MATFSIDASDMEELNRKLSLLKDKLSDFSEPMEEIGEALRLMIDDSFEEQRDPWGKRWEALSEVTKKIRQGTKRRKHTNQQILIDTGRLRNGIIARATKTSVTVGVSKGRVSSYAPTQQFGNRNNRLPNRSEGRRAPIPARPFLPIKRNGEVHLPPKMKEEIEQILIDWITEPWEAK